MRKTEPARHAWLLMAALLLAFVAINGFGEYSAQPPLAQAVDAPADQFSAARAFTHVEKIAQRPRATGSVDNVLVRKYLIETLRALDLQVEVQRQVVSYRYQRYPHEARFATVNNVLARLPGRGGQGKHLLLMSHYDSRESTPGAGDAAAGVATLLESARAMRTQAAPLNDVLFLFTDAEEIGLLGAQAFFRHHPAAENTGFVLNFDARGSRGTAYMFQTSDPAGPLIELMQQEVARPWANSLSLAAYKQIPNDTDLSIALEHGAVGMNFAFIDGFFDYHQPTDQPEHLSLNTLQHFGDYALPLATRLANEAELGALGESGSERSFFFVPGLGLIDYPAWIDLVAAGVLGLVLVLVVLRLRWEARLSAGQMLRGLIAVVLALGMPLLLIVQLQSGLFAGSGMRPVLAQLARPEWLWWSYSITATAFAIWLLAAATRGKGGLPTSLFVVLVIGAQALSTSFNLYLAAVAAGLTLLAGVVYFKPLNKAALLTGFATLGILLMTTLAFFLPAGLFLLVWPLSLPAVWWLLSGQDMHSRRSLRLISAIAALPAALLLLPFARDLFIMLSAMSAAIAMLPLVLALLCALPLVLARDLRSPAALASLAGLATLLWAAATTPFSPRFPEPVSVFTVQIDDTSYRVSDDTALTAWHRQILGDTPTEMRSERYAPGRSNSVFSREVALPLLDRVSIQVTEQPANTAESQRLRLTLQVPSKARQLQLYVPTRLGLKAWSVNGEALSPPAPERKAWHLLRGFAAPQEGSDIELEIDADADLAASEFVLTAYYPSAEGELALPPRPADQMRAPYTYADGVLVVQRFIAQPTAAPEISHDSFEPDAVPSAEAEAEADDRG